MYSKDQRNRPSLDNLDFDTLDLEEGQWLQRKFEEKVRAAVFALAGDKAPRPDGFPMAFFQRFWSEVKEDVIEAFLVFALAGDKALGPDCFPMEELYFRGKLLKRLGVSFISLIPKRKGDIGIKDYRPISLIGSIYKILAKVLAGRIQRVLPSIVS